MLPDIAQAVRSRNARDNYIADKEDGPGIEELEELRSSALNSMNRRQVDSTQQAQFPADIMPAVSEKNRKAVEKGEFIDLGTLLPSLTPQDPNMKFQLLSPNAAGDTVLAIGSHSQRKKISSFESWLKAWNIYLRCMVICHPHLTSQLLYYQAEISQLATLYSFKQWYLYDWDYRIRIANNNISRWDYHDIELRAKYLVAPSFQSQNNSLSSYTCWVCNQPGHLANQCPNPSKQSHRSSSYSSSLNPSSSFAQRSTQQPFPVPQRENSQRNANLQLLGNRQQPKRQCMYWNQERGCINPQCKFEHKCSQCQQPDHGSQHCRHR